MEVPERPRLAPDVGLNGEMQGSGFADRQWLVQRGGTFIQVTELLYRVAEHANGERDLDEIAEAVTEATEWQVTADHVRLLIQSKLVPLGLIANADGSAPSSARDRRSSPLELGARLKVFSPSAIERVTRVVQHLFAPSLLVPMSVIILIGHLWLYLDYGISSSIYSLIANPELLLITFALVVLSGIVHEFGHAAALHYGGGRARSMGAGLYIIYPAFYTDTTDSYRLSRAARVRTDLGGFYFHLIFALLMMAAYFATGHDFLLAVVFLININILFQWMPFIKLDGYWVLVDLTGIPDFFSQMGPFVRSIVPRLRTTGTNLPKLKPWVKAVFVGYILVVVPMLFLMLVFLVLRLPAMVTLVGQQLQQLAGVFAAARFAGDVAAMAATALQMFILALPLAGVAYFLGRIIMRPLVMLWLRPTLASRSVAAIGTTGILALAGFVWLPQLGVTFARSPVPEGVQTFEIVDRAHVSDPVRYEQVPPVGGPHAPIWQNCGFYDGAIADEHGVHSMEHGAVWITYRPDLPEAQVARLRDLTRGRTYVLTSPYPELPTAVVASAWGHQLQLDSAEDPRLEQFVDALRLGRQAPERGGSCTGGVGDPA